MHGHRARRRFSQNFLHDAHYIARIVDAIDPQPAQHILEIGPGLGALTERLIERAGHVTCLEIDRDLAARLRERWSPAQLTLIEGDALEFDWQRLAAPDTAPGATSSAPAWRIVGNLPYHISTPLLFALLPVASAIRDEHFMLQKEVVDRMAARPGGREYGRLSVMLQFRYRVERLFNVPAGAFSPAPQVQSSLVRLQPRPPAELPAVDFETFSAVVTAAFGQRRKTLRNALGALLDERRIWDAGVDPGQRAETLETKQFVALANLAGRGA